MKKIYTLLTFLMAGAILFLLGFAFNWANQRSAQASIDLSGIGITQTSRQPVLSPTSLLPTKGAILETLESPRLDALTDFRRGPLLNDEIRQSLIITQSQVVKDVLLQVSDVVLYDSRAYIKTCISSPDAVDPMDFGSSTLTSSEGIWINFYINGHPALISPEQGRCLILEYWDIPPIYATSMQFTMDIVGYVVPDEGRFCEAYQRRSLRDQRVVEAGIEFSCDEVNGAFSMEITRNDQNIPENIVYGMVQDVVVRAVPGPWSFDLPVIHMQ